MPKQAVEPDSFRAWGIPVQVPRPFQVHETDFERALSMQLRLTQLLRYLAVFYLSYFRKKRSDIWVFGAMRGHSYADNARYLFEYVNQHSSIQAIWISKSEAVVSNLRDQGFQAYVENTREALRYAAQAKIAVVTHRGNREKGDLPFQAFNKNTRIVQLWHGIPLKMIAYDDTLFSFRHDEESYIWKFKGILKRFLFPFLDYVNQPTLVLALSDETRSIFSGAFRIPEDHVVITGYPRNDILIKHQGSSKAGVIENLIYMPTFRGEEQSSFNPFSDYEFDVNKLDLFLENNGMKLDIKLHAFNRPTGDLLRQLTTARNISFLDCEDIYTTLDNYDLLITDYSSIYFDYLLLDRPMIFAPFDYDEFTRNNRQLYFNYDDTTPGPKAKSWEEVMEHIRLFIDNPDYFVKERSAIKDRFHHFQDSHSARRVYETIAEIADRA